MEEGDRMGWEEKRWDRMENEGRTGQGDFPEYGEEM